MTDPLPLRAARIVIALSTLAAVAAGAWLARDGLSYLLIVFAAAGLVAGRWCARPAAAVILAVAPMWLLGVALMTGAPHPRASDLWLAALAGLVVGGAPVTRWSMPGVWRVPIATWGLTLAIGWPIMIARELDFTLVTYRQVDVASSLWSWAARDSAAFATGSTLAVLTMLLLFDWLWSRYGTAGEAGRTRFLRDVAAPLTFGSLASLALGAYQGLVDIRWMNLGSWPMLRRASSTMLDANAFGAIAALWSAPAAGRLLLGRGVARTMLGLALVALVAVAVWASGSRTAFLALGAIAGGMLLSLWRGSRLSPTGIVVIAGALVVVVTLVGGLGGPGNAAARVWSTLPSPTVESVVRFARDLWERDGYATAAHRAWRDFPWAGVGPGTFLILSPDYVFLTMTYIVSPDNAQNWWRQQWTELGIIGGMAPLVCSLLIVAAIWRAWGSGRSSAWLAACTVMAAGGVALVGPPMLHPIVAQVVAVLVFWLTIESERGTADLGTSKGVPYVRNLNRRLAMVVWVVPIVWASVAWPSATGPLRPPFRAERAGWLYAYGFSAPEAGPEGDVRSAGPHAVAVIPATGSQVTLTLSTPHTDIATRPVRVRVSSRDVVVLDVERRSPETFSCTIPVPDGRSWVMVQIDTDRPWRTSGGLDEAIRVSARF